MQAPSNVKELKTFMGMVNYISKFISKSLYCCWASTYARKKADHVALGLIIIRIIWHNKTTHNFSTSTEILRLKKRRNYSLWRFLVRLGNSTITWRTSFTHLDRSRKKLRIDWKGSISCLICVLKIQLVYFWQNC